MDNEKGGSIFRVGYLICLLFVAYILLHGISTIADKFASADVSMEFPVKP